MIKRHSCPTWSKKKPPGEERTQRLLKYDGDIGMRRNRQTDGTLRFVEWMHLAMRERGALLPG